MKGMTPMHITMTMTEEEYEMYRDFLKQRSTLEANVAKAYDALLAEHLRLCSAVLEAISDSRTWSPDLQPDSPVFYIASKADAECALQLAKKALTP